VGRRTRARSTRHAERSNAGFAGSERQQRRTATSFYAFERESI
jgi:hypothetical protein